MLKMFLFAGIFLLLVPRRKKIGGGGGAELVFSGMPKIRMFYSALVPLLFLKHLFISPSNKSSINVMQENIMLEALKVQKKN